MPTTMRTPSSRPMRRTRRLLSPVQRWGTHHIHASPRLLTTSSRRARADVWSPCRLACGGSTSGQPGRRSHYGHHHHAYYSASPCAPCDAGADLPRVPRCGRAGQMAAADMASRARCTRWTPRSAAPTRCRSRISPAAKATRLVAPISNWCRTHACATRTSSTTRRCPEKCRRRLPCSRSPSARR